MVCFSKNVPIESEIVLMFAATKDAADAWPTSEAVAAAESLMSSPY